MVIDWSQSNGKASSRDPKLRAAEYVRMSTEHQRYSTENQSSVIRTYANERNFAIVRTYADEGKSGLRVAGRHALQNLLADIENQRADYQVILVYDVSRWGRFQDPDEAAAIELKCKRAGIAIHYCAEQFENDGSVGSSIVKTVKRVMAGEYSRELSVKVFTGQSHLIRLGFRQGGAAGFGLRRRLVDQAGNPKGELGRGEQKSLATDRVVLVPGPASETAVVREIYELFIERGLPEGEIAAVLNSRGVATDLGRPWTRGTVHQVLINEKYCGANVWGRTSFKLKQVFVRNPQESWIRADNAFPAVIDRTLFSRARAVIQARSAHVSDERMLELLAEVLKRSGYLTGLIIDEAEDCPSSSSYQYRFGCLLRAYALVGYQPDHDYRYVEINRQLRRMHPELVEVTIAGVRRAGGDVEVDAETDVLRVNQEFTISIVLSRCFQTSAGSLRWKIRLDTALCPDMTVAVRMGLNNEQALDYYVLPRMTMTSATLRLCEYNGLSLDAFRFSSLDDVCDLARRGSLAGAA